MHKTISSSAPLAQAIRYLVVAGSMALFYLGVFAVGLQVGWFYLIAILVAQVITILIAFPLYRALVFRSHGGLRGDFVRFLSIWLTGAIAGVVVTPLLVELVHLHPLVAQVVAVAVVSVGSFLAHRFFSFRHGTPSPLPTSDDLAAHTDRSAVTGRGEVR